MKYLIFALLLIFNCKGSNAQQWRAKWISTMENQSATNTWLAYRKSFVLTEKPSKAIARVAVDSKYWLWVNGTLVVFEGGLKRGPTPVDTYFDEIDIAPYLRKDSNIVAVMVWHFGKDGFAHTNSGKAALLFDCNIGRLNLTSDISWKCAVLGAYQTAGAPSPNFRLAESSILYDARREIGQWYAPAYNDTGMPGATEVGEAGSSPWNKLVKRPIPLFKNFGLKQFASSRTIEGKGETDTIECDLPYNSQFTPYIKLQAPAGKKIIMFTDNYSTYNGNADYIRGEYITKEGLQEYESLGWINGHRMYYLVPKGVQVLEVQFRESGYNTEFAGSFTCSQPFFNKLWEKARRTLYITMRDNYMDCPDRERAQWTGDAVIEAEEAFYALDTQSHALARKWLYELMNWQRKDSSIYSPVPAGNWTMELPDQSAASVGYYGLWNYYLHTGDKKTLGELYDKAKQYALLWKLNEQGTIRFRPGGWTWGDWGSNRDVQAQFNLWYYLMLKGLYRSALALDKKGDAAFYVRIMKKLKNAFNRQFWNGSAYRDNGYKGATDDRVQALAVLSGVADKGKFRALLNVFQTEEHASPYMEKYVFEAMFRMGYAAEALQRHQKRFAAMVNHPYFTTLFEGWGIGNEGFGGGTVNHAWSGGGLTVLSQYLCGIAPLEAGYRRISILPQPANIEKAEAVVSSVAGIIRSSFINRANEFMLDVTVPAGTTAVVGIPDGGFSKIYLNNELVWQSGKYLVSRLKPEKNEKTEHIIFDVRSGDWTLKALK